MNSEIAEKVDEWSDLMEFIKSSKDAKIVVHKLIYPGCLLKINCLSKRIKDEIVASYVQRNGDVIEMIPFI